MLTALATFTAHFAAPIAIALLGVYLIGVIAILAFCVAPFGRADEKQDQANFDGEGLTLAALLWPLFAMALL